MKTNNHHNNNDDHHHHHPTRLKPIFTCASFFRHCTQPSHSPTAPPSPSPPPRKPATAASSSSSSSSHSFTQWRFPPTINTQQQQKTEEFSPGTESRQTGLLRPTSMSVQNIRQILDSADISFRTGSDPERSAALHALEHALVPNPPSDTDPIIPGSVIDGVLGYIASGVSVKAATKVLLAMCLAENNRRVAVDRGAVGRVVEALGELDDGSAERALAALELMCTVPEGAVEIRGHALAVPVLVAAMGRLEGRGREYAIGVLAVVFGGREEERVGDAPPEEVACAVVLAMEGECSARGRRNGQRLLKVLDLDRSQRLDLIQDESS